MPDKNFAPPPHTLDRNLALEVVRVTEASALAAAMWMGRGTEKAAEDHAAEAMQRALNSLVMDARIVNGRHGDDDHPLKSGQRVGSGDGPQLDIALIPIEGVTICAKGGLNALSVVAATESGSFLSVPDRLYMEKIAVGPHMPPGLIDLSRSPEDNLHAVADAKKVSVADLTVCMLDRPRHAELLGRLYEAGARVVLIDDGDVSGAIAVGLPETGIDLYMGSGGAAEGVLAAAGLKCLGGQMQGRLLLRSEEDRAVARRAGLENPSAIWTLDDMVQGDVMFAATGITNGHLLQGVHVFPGGALSHSLVMRSQTGTIRTMTTRHDFARHGRMQSED